jgi:osmotically-inducible protein OsmY
MTTLRNPDVKDVQMEEKISRIIQDRGKCSQVFNVVRGGYVNLMGYVDGSDVKKSLATLVEEIPGVEMVTNHIRLKPFEGQGAITHF